MPADPRLQKATSSLAAAHRRKNSTQEDIDNARNNLAYARIDVLLDRTLDGSVTLTEEQVERLQNKLKIDGLGLRRFATRRLTVVEDS